MMREKLLALGASVGVAGSSIAAAFASLCCVGPAAFALLGATGVTFAALLTPYRIHLLSASLALLVLAFWRFYRPAKAASGGDCPARIGRGMRLALWGSLALWAASALTFAATALPGLLEPQAAASEHESLGAVADPLRSAFNADIGKVRVLMLVAPT